MHVIRYLMPAFCGFLMLSSAEASVTTIDFDSFPGMTNIPGLPVPLASQLSDQLLSVCGVSFSSAADYVAVSNHSPSLTVSMPNVIGGVTPAGELSYGTFVKVSFFDPSNSALKAVTDFVSIRGDQHPLLNATATMEAFDVFGHSLGTVTAFDSTAGLTLSLTLPEIHSILLTQNSASIYDGTIGFDNLQFNSLKPIPVPGAILLGILGSSFVGWLRRRRVI